MGISKASLDWKYKNGVKPFIYRSTVGDTDINVAERHCCGNCGCNILLQYYLYPEKSHVAASTVVKNDFEALKVGCHIWCRQAPKWYTIPDDGIERHEEFDEDFQAKLDEHLSRRGGA